MRDWLNHAVLPVRYVPKWRSGAAPGAALRDWAVPCLGRWDRPRTCASMRPSVKLELGTGAFVVRDVDALDGLADPKVGRSISMD